MSDSSKTPLFALVDGNNFFCSCERIFNPSIQQKPVLVLSGNDGCVIARSQEAKDLGIPMGVPVFKVRDVILRHQIQLFSANFSLYRDISDRMMQILEEWSPQMEVYSVDEAFLWNPFLPSPEKWGIEVRKKVAQDLGIPVSIGIAPTKTLAKLANRSVKKLKKPSGVWVWDPHSSETESLLKTTPCEEIWGIGKESALRLQSVGIHTIADFKNAERPLIRRLLSVVGERLWMEIRGTSVLEIDESPEPQKSILSSRSFGKEVDSLSELQESISMHLSGACEKLRHQKLKAHGMGVFIRGNRFKENKTPHRSHAFYRFDQPSDYTPLFIDQGLRLLQSLYQPHRRYQKAGIYLSELQSHTIEQLTWFHPPSSQEKQTRLMEVMDRMNQRWGGETIRFGSSGLQRSWLPKSQYRSPRYTTSWNDLMIVSSR